MSRGFRKEGRDAHLAQAIKCLSLLRPFSI